MGIGLEAAGGLSAVQALLRQRFEDQIAAQERNQRAMESDREFGLKSQEANLRGQAFKQQSADRADALAQRVQGERDTAALKAAPSVGMGNSIDQPQYAKTFAGTAAESQFQPQMTLPATQMSGTGDPGSMQAQPAPQTPTGRQTFLGTPQQRQEAQDSSALDALANDPSTPGPVRGFLRVRKVIPKGESVPAQLFETKPEHVGESNFTLPGVGPIVGLKNANGRIVYQGKDVTDQVKPYVAPPTPAANDTRMDRSYQLERSALDKLAKPLEDQQQKLGDLNELLGQGTPQADALVAPKLLTVMVGGQGSGLRMNEAEISRIVGGRSKWESLKAAAQQWSLDPTKANSITPEQRTQIRALVQAVHEKSQSALKVVNEAGANLIDAPDVLSHRKVLGDVRTRLQGIYEGGGAAGTGGTVKMRAPNGQEKDVSPSEVEHYKAQGAVVVK